MSETQSTAPEGEEFETERARWFIRLLYNREPTDQTEIISLRNRFRGHSTSKFLYYASHLPDFHKQAQDTQNIMLDSLFRKRAEYVVPGRIEQMVPNLYVIGQPRSGTTSLHDYFMDHPDVFVPMVKETNYYSHWAEAFWGKGGLRYEDYLMYFMDAEDQRVRCDISPYYLSEPGVALRIYRDSPRARLIAILRDPIELIISKFNLDHANSDAVDIDNWIARGLAQYKDHGPRWAYDTCATALFHCNIALSLSEYIRYFRRRARLYIFEEVIRDQAAAYRDICEYLQIPFVYEREYWSWRSSGAARPSEPALHELAAVLLPMVKQIENVTGRDLGMWYSRWTW